MLESKTPFPRELPVRSMAFLMLAWLLTAPVSAQQIYRHVAEDGTVSYSDQPAPDAERIRVDYIQAPPASSAVRMANSRAADDDGDSDSDAGADPEQAESARSPSERAEEQCRLAQERLSAYSRATRLYRTMPDGSREFLNDDQIDAARTEAEAELDRWCN